MPESLPEAMHCATPDEPGGLSTTPPVLFLLFNRPALTARVFERIRAARPSRLYIAADGPRPGEAGEPERCEAARMAAGPVDWPCEVHTLYRDANLGCRHGVRQAIDWFFEHEESGVILEDDCLPDASWFPFAAELLERYREEENVICVAGSHFHGDAHTPPDSYFFSIYNHCWGWASWRRAWVRYDDQMARWPELRETDWLQRLGGGNRAFHAYWTRIFDKIHAQRLDSWAYYWTWSAFSTGGITVLPARHLVTNIGFGAQATHTRGAGQAEAIDRLEQMTFPLDHPATTGVDMEADRWTARHHFGITWPMLIWRKLASLPVLAAPVRTLKRVLGRPG